MIAFRTCLGPILFRKKYPSLLVRYFLTTLYHPLSTPINSSTYLPPSALPIKNSNMSLRHRNSAISFSNRFTNPPIVSTFKQVILNLHASKLFIHNLAYIPLLIEEALMKTKINCNSKVDSKAET